jgi:hypothetical protein
MIIGVMSLIAMQRCLPKLTGVIITQTLTFDQLSELSIGGLFNVTLTQADNNEINITADEAFFPCITIHENGDQISLSHRWNCTFFAMHKPQITVDVSFQQLKKLDLGGANIVKSLNEAIIDEAITLKVSGASEAEIYLTAPMVEGKVSGASTLTLSGMSEKLLMKVSGASTLNLTTISTELSLKASGASSVTTSGTTSLLFIDASGASDVNAVALKADKADLKASGASDITVHVSEIVSQKSTGASKIVYS